MTKAGRVFLGFISILLLLQFDSSKGEKLCKNENDLDQCEHIVALAEDNKKFLSEKDKIDAEHFIPKGAVEKAVKKCHSDESCRNSETATKLQKLLNFELTLTLRKENHALTPTYGSSKTIDAIAGLLEIGNFKQAFSMAFDGYRKKFEVEGKEVFWQKTKGALGQIATHYKSVGILSEKEHDQISDKYGLTKDAPVPGKSFRNGPEFRDDIREKAPEQQRSSFKDDFAPDRIQKKGAIIKQLGNQQISVKKAKLVGINENGMKVSGNMVKTMARSVNPNVHR